MSEERKELFQIPVTQQDDKSMSNRKRKITFITQENLTDEEVGKIARNNEKFGWLTFNPAKVRIKPEDVVNLPEIQTDDDTKSPAKRLRDRMFVFYKARHSEKIAQFNSWYVDELERLGQQYLDKVN